MTVYSADIVSMASQPSDMQTLLDCEVVASFSRKLLQSNEYRKKGSAENFNFSVSAEAWSAFLYDDKLH